MRKFLFVSSVFTFGFTVGYDLHAIVVDEIIAQAQKRAEGDYSYNKKSVVSRLAKWTLDEVEVQRFSEFLNIHK